MSRIMTNLSDLYQEATKLKEMSVRLDELADAVRREGSTSGMSMASYRTIQGKLKSLSDAIEAKADRTKAAAIILDNVATEYQKSENRLIDLTFGNLETSFEEISGAGHSEEALEEETVWDRFMKEFSSNYGWGGLLAGAGYIGTIHQMIQDIRNGKTWGDFAKTGVKFYQFLSGAAKTYKNYKRIGNAVGTKKAMTWWAKSITGLKPLGRASTAKNPFTRFVNNLTNKTSPFHAQFENVIGNFKGANGVGKAVASWGAVAMNGVLNWFDNKEEQADSNGTMSDGRVIAETITETAVDTVLTYGAGIVVGAAVTTVLGTAAAPGVIVVALSGAVVVGLNAGVKALTGKTTTEWISDGILDAGEAIGNAAKNVKNSIGNWFSKLSFA